MSAAHTPGPWKDTGYGVRDSGGFICSMTWPCHYPGQDERYAQETAQREADARLIAAAPDLLKALQAFMALDATFTTICTEGLAELAANPGRRGDMPRAVQKARAAIAKATGSAS